MDLQGRWPREAKDWDALRTDIMTVVAPWSGKFALKICRDEFSGDQGFGLLFRIYRDTHRNEADPLVVIAANKTTRHAFEILRLPFKVVETEEEALGLPPPT